MTRTFTANRVRRADGANHVFLQHAQQLHLQARRHVADLIEHQRAAIRRLEQAAMCARGARERTLLVTEQFRLEKVLRHRGAIDRNEGLVPTRARAMDRAGEQFLARAAFTGDEHARIGAGDHVGLRELLFHHRAARDDLGTPVFIGSAEARDAQRFLHLVQQFLLVDRLREEAERAHLRRLHGVGNRAVRGEDDDLQAGPAILQFLQEADAVHLVHAKVGDDEVGPEAARGGECLHAALDRFYVVILRAQADGEQAKQARIVVDHQDACLAFAGLVHDRIPSIL